MIWCGFLDFAQESLQIFLTDIYHVAYVFDSFIWVIIVT